MQQQGLHYPRPRSWYFKNNSHLPQWKYQLHQSHVRPASSQHCHEGPIYSWTGWWSSPSPGMRTCFCRWKYLLLMERKRVGLPQSSVRFRKVMTCKNNYCDVTRRMFLDRHDFLDKLPDPMKLTLARLAEYVWLMTDRWNMTLKYRKLLREVIEVEAKENGMTEEKSMCMWLIVAKKQYRSYIHSSKTILRNINTLIIYTTVRHQCIGIALNPYLTRLFLSQVAVILAVTSLSLSYRYYLFCPLKL